MINGACYVRVSTENQLENYSIEEQTDRLKAFCLAKDIAIVKLYTDGGYSGGNTRRPALLEMLKDIESGGIDTVIVYKLDRLSRSQKDTLMLIEDHFLAHNVDFISVNENFDTSTPFGRAMIGILSVFAQLEKDQITERFTMGRIGRAKNGYFHGGACAPTGYDYIGGQLVVNEYEALQVRDLYERFARGLSLHSCWQYMHSHYTTKYGTWSSETLVRNVLKNNVYTGKVKFRGQSYGGRHEPIVSCELFDRVQDRFKASYKSPGGAAPFKARTLLSSFLYCGRCGARFHGEHGNYSCYSRTKGDKKYVIDPDCRNRKWKITTLDQLVITSLSELDFEKAGCDEEQRLPHSPCKRLSEIDSQIGRLADLYQFNHIPLETLSSRINALAAEKERLSRHPAEAAGDPPAQITPGDCFLRLMEEGGLSEKRTCLSHLVDRIIVNDEKISILLK